MIVEFLKLEMVNGECRSNICIRDDVTHLELYDSHIHGEGSPMFSLYSNGSLVQNCLVHEGWLSEWMIDDFNLLTYEVFESLRARKGVSLVSLLRKPKEALEKRLKVEWEDRMRRSTMAKYLCQGQRFKFAGRVYTREGARDASSDELVTARMWNPREPGNSFLIEIPADAQVTLILAGDTE